MAVTAGGRHLEGRGIGGGIPAADSAAVSFY